MDCHCTGTKGEHLKNCVQQATDPAISLHRGVPPSIPGGIRGSSKAQGVLGHVLEESPYP